MVWGNLATGYWLGGAAAAGLHWVELGRGTLSSTGDNIDVYGSDDKDTTYSNDFSSDNMVDQNSTYFGISSNVLNFDARRNSSNHASSWDLGSTLSDSQWVLRYKMTVSTITQQDSTCRCFMGMSSLPSSTNSNGSHDFIGFHAKVNASLKEFKYMTTNGSSLDIEGTKLMDAAATTYYVELIRKSTTTFSLRITTSSDYTGGDFADNISCSASTTGLQYFWIGNVAVSGTENARFIGTIDDMKIWNNTTRAASDLAAKPYMMVLGHGINSGAVRQSLRFNGDTGSNYAWRTSANGGSSGSGETSNARIVIGNQTTSGQDDFSTSYISNGGTQEPLVISHVVKNSGTGAGNSPDRSECVGKRGNTEDITSVQLFNTEGGDFASGSECVVLGCDPDDTEGTSVWEELKSVSLSSGADTLDTGSFTAKKYLWIQGHIISTTQVRSQFQFNSDTGSNYANRNSANGGSDTTNTSQAKIYLNDLDKSSDCYFEAFIINKSDKEKLIMYQDNWQDTAGAGTAPARTETVAKWANTSAQISSIQLLNDRSGDFASGTSMKVWGFD